MKRRLLNVSASIDAMDCTDLSNMADPTRWFVEHAMGMLYLLAYFDDGVVWGRFDGATLATSSQVTTDISLPRCEP